MLNGSLITTAQGVITLWTQTTTKQTGIDRLLKLGRSN